MGRGRGGGSGRGRGGGGKRAGGVSSRGRGGSSSRGRGRSCSRGKVSTLSRKDTAHLRQFGESHPADTLSDFTSPAKKFKSGEMDRKPFRNRGGFNPNHRASSEEESEDESEEEVTPYNELLSIYTGQKGKKAVQIVSESEEDSEEEDSDSERGGTNDNDENEGDDLQALEEAEDDADADEEPANKNSSGPLPSSEGKEFQDKNITQNSEQDEVEEVVTLVDERVIDEAELDPEAEDDNSSPLDPFLTHFQRELSAELQSVLWGNKPYEKRLSLDWPTLEKLQYSGMKVGAEDKEEDPKKTKTHPFLPSESNIIIHPPSSPPEEPGNPTLESLHLKTQMHSTIPIANQRCIDRGGCSAPLTPLQKELLLLAANYRDVYFPMRNSENEEEVRMAYCIHATNHILKTRTRIVHHNAKMSNKVEVPEEYRDQGFVRPKVLILTPFKETALRIVKTLISLVLTDEKGNVQNKKRFVDEYSGETLFFPKTNPKPDDYMAMFSGNVDDNFKIGLAITKKSIKLYTGFYASDVIVASPVGLRMIVGAEGEKDRDYDFLSSIEMVIMDQSDVFLMQNWDHLLHLLKHLHLQPKTTHETNFARIRPWALDNLTKFYCQTLVFSSLICPEHLALFSRYARNYAGFVKIINPIPTSCISQITVQLPQVFQQFECGSVADVSEARFEHFLNKVLANFKGKLMSHTLIFVSSYFDFVRLRNYFRKEEQSFVQICEYTKDKKIARARDLFFHGKNKFLLYTERAHFFRRFRLKGIGHIIFYQLPQYPHFYSELCNYMQEGHQNRRVRQRKNCSVNVIYCKYDATRLASLVGTERANYMLASDKPTHAFVTESL